LADYKTAHEWLTTKQFNALASFQLTLTGNNKSYYRYDIIGTGSCSIKATEVALACMRPT